MTNRLEDLDHAAGMSISGFRATYDDEITTVAERTGARQRRTVRKEAVGGEATAASS